MEVTTLADAERVQAVYRDWRAGKLALATLDARRRSSVPALGRVLAHHPVLVALLAVAGACLPVTWPLDDGRLGAWLPHLTIVPVDVVDGRIVAESMSEALRRGEVWRLVAPSLLHVSFAHFALNAALVAHFGRAVERGSGHLGLAAVVFASAVAANFGQYLLGGDVLFCGLSGVACGLFGFVVVRSRQRPEQAVWRQPAGLVLATFTMLVLLSTRVTELFGLTIANSAHWCGLVAGALCALVVRRRAA
jgi:GlpG protein